MSQADLTTWLASHYELPGPIVIHLLRSYTNDVFVVTVPDRRFILKIYGSPWRTESDIRYEVALLQHLAGKNLSVTAPVNGTTGFINRIHYAEKDTHAVLFDYAEGAKPKPPFTAELYVAFGSAIARMHERSNDFVTRYARVPLDADLLLDAPLPQILPLLSRPEDRAFLNSLVTRLKDQLALFAAQGLEWGPIHGDASLDNLHVTAQGDVILYDFDSGGPGWRAADLQGWAAIDPIYKDRWAAFHAGYSRVRRLDPVNLEAAPFLTIAWDIWGMKIDLDNRLRQAPPEKIQTYLTETLARISERCRQCGFTE